MSASPTPTRAGYGRAVRHESRDALWIAGMASSASTPPVIERDIIEVFRRYVERAAERALLHGGMTGPEDLPETRKLLAIARCDPDAIRWDRFVDAIREAAAELDATIDYGRPA